jgi:hypothetical protein
MSTESQEELSPFQRNVRTIDPKLLADAMGASDRPPEEPLLSDICDGYGYHTAVAPGRALGNYMFVRKVRSKTSSPQPRLIIECSSVGQFPPLSGSRSEFLFDFASVNIFLHLHLQRYVDGGRDVRRYEGLDGTCHRLHRQRSFTRVRRIPEGRVHESQQPRISPLPDPPTLFHFRKRGW